MFSDIKDFTHYSSTFSPDRIRAFLNEYFETMVDIVFKYNGTLDKYIGDGLMVLSEILNLARPCPASGSAAVAMQKKAAELMQKWLGEAVSLSKYALESTRGKSLSATWAFEKAFLYRSGFRGKSRKEIGILRPDEWDSSFPEHLRINKILRPNAFLWGNSGKGYRTSREYVRGGAGRSVGGSREGVSKGQRFFSVCLPALSTLYFAKYGLSFSYWP